MRDFAHDLVRKVCNFSGPCASHATPELPSCNDRGHLYGGREMPTPAYGLRSIARAAACRALAHVAAALVGLAAACGAQTDPMANYPSRPIRLVVGFAAGGGNDLIARIVGQKLHEALGQPVIIENKPGANGSLAALAVMAAPADGYTLLIGASGAMSIVPAVSVKPPYDTRKAFAPVSELASFPLILSRSEEHT